MISIAFLHFVLYCVIAFLKVAHSLSHLNEFEENSIQSTENHVLFYTTLLIPQNNLIRMFYESLHTNKNKGNNFGLNQRNWVIGIPN